MPRTLHYPVKLKNSNCVRSRLLPAGGCFLPVVPQGDSFQEAQYFLFCTLQELCRSVTPQSGGTGGKA